jgi:hypothetical protein
VRKLLFQMCIAAGLAALVAAPAGAQSRPLVTEDPETVPAGFMLLEAGLEYQHSAVFPATGLAGNRWRIGTFGLSIGVSSIAELQIDGGLRDRLLIENRSYFAPLAGFVTATGDSTATFEDLLVGAKVRFVSETDSRPAVALRFTTRLPNSSLDSGLSLDTFDFNIGMAVAKTVRSTRVAMNAGIGFLDDPTEIANQTHMINFGTSVARAVGGGVEVVAELTGRFNVSDEEAPPGNESRGAVRFGGRVTQGPVRVDGGLLIGLTDRDPSWGFTAGLTWVFRAFEVK